MAAELKGRISIDADSLDRVNIKIRDFETQLMGAFRRTGEARPAAALESFIQNLSSGSVTGAIEGVASRLTGLGLVGGVAFGTLSYGLSKFVENISAAQQAFSEVGKTLATPALLTTFEELNKASDKMTALSGVRGFFTREQQGDVAVRGDIAAKQHQTELTEKFVQSIDAQITRQKQVADVAFLEAAGQKDLAEQLKNRISLEDKLNQIQAQAAAARQALRDKQSSMNPLPADEAARRGNAITDFVVGMQQGAETDDERNRQGAKYGFLQSRYGGVSGDELTQAGQLVGNSGFQTQRRMSFPVALQGDAYRLRTAQGLIGEGERLRRAGLFDEAKKYGEMGEGMKSEVHSLNQNERAPEYLFKNALDSSSVLRDISAGIKSVEGAVKNISFKNQ